MSVDAATVKRIATLARIRIEDAALPRMVEELNGILAWVEMLREVDTQGVEPMAGGAPTGQPSLRMREDEVTDGGIAEAILANAPDREGPYFAVPKVVE
ncbi:MAG: Asp-tRNA(Asn)/Glu-tRNA(Gln) amidotransferase subunit GatC [Rhodovarius sp.]|nr:Asp-tRNA(Asn)/Glu-tRNA(Gln) amidotransferase subunit GatC [Rhodovarius sp.]MCX7931576.1 Asp-tRNA(Asn)/Glu-tRNA(Gln) amidotransferase subunit GatC [Rhodovarius sp.]MDW8315668.1 Asp-tRNA(Asn)/Glu-tRNA(Gln) amidotransferase subunit GatC [Rhodovarius sp.]